MGKEMTIVTVATIGGLLAISSAAKAGALSYDFTEIAAPGSITTSPLGMNNIGQIVGAYIDDAGNGHGFVERDGSYVDINFPGAIFRPRAA